MRNLRLLLLTGAFTCAAATAAGAAAPSVSIGLTVNGTFGQHVEPAGAVNLPLIPIPIIDARVRSNDFELRAEALPPIGAIGWKPTMYDIRTTRLGYGSATLFYHLHGGLSAGIGDTLFTQYSTFTPTRYGALQTQQSRLSGVRWAAMYEYAIGNDAAITASLAASPVMHANVTSTYSPANLPSYQEGETASLVDASVAAERQFGAPAVEIGLRYINYTGRFDRTGQLADRNRLLMPFVGVHWRLR